MEQLKIEEKEEINFYDTILQKEDNAEEVGKI